MSRRLMIWMGAALGVALWITVKMVIPVASAQQAQPVSTSDANTPLIKAETRLVLVDTIVTDKKGNYISDLVQKDFKVWEDDKEQADYQFLRGSGARAGQQRSEALPGAVLRQLYHGHDRPGSRPGRGGEIHCCQCRSEPIDGDCGLHRRGPYRAELH